MTRCYRLWWHLFLGCLFGVLAASPLRAEFDHYSTGFPLEGAHAQASCDSCHAQNVFRGLDTACVSCHSAAGFVTASRQPASHPTTTNQCGSCHGDLHWTPLAKVDHLETLGPCASCHDGIRAQGKFIGHLPTSDACESCHRTNSFALARFDHVGIVAGCTSCHNNVQAQGQPAGHIAATQLCESCHAVSRFSPVIDVDHMEVVGTCSSCHNGTVAMGQPVGHIPTTLECDSCHNTNAWGSP